jgi:hypothetical protein
MRTTPLASSMAAIGLAIMPATAEAAPRAPEMSIATEMYGDPCGPVVVEDEPVDPRLVAAVAELGRASLAAKQEQGIYPPVELHIHYLKGGAAHNVLSDSGFDKYINNVAKECKFDESDGLLTLVNYTQRERDDYNRRFGNLDLSFLDNSRLQSIYNNSFFESFRADLSDDLADSSSPVQEDLTAAVSDLTREFETAVENLSQEPTTHETPQPSTPQEPSKTAEWLKENWPSLPVGALGLGFVVTGGVLMSRKKRIRGEVLTSTTDVDSLLRQTIDSLNGKGIFRFASNFKEDSYPEELRITTESDRGNYTTNDTPLGYIQDRVTPSDQYKETADDGLHDLLENLTNYTAFMAMFGPDKLKAAEQSVKDLLGDNELKKLWEIRGSLIESVNSMATGYIALREQGKRHWPNMNEFDQASEHLDFANEAVAELITAYDAQFGLCEQAAKESSARFEMLRAQLASSQASLDALTGAGWEVTPLTKDHKRHEKAVDNLLKKALKQPIAASEEAAGYAGTLDSFCTECDSYEGRFVENERLQSVRQDTLDRLDKDTSRAANVLDALRPQSTDGYHESCTQDIAEYDQSMAKTLSELKKAQAELSSQLAVKSVETVRQVENKATQFNETVQDVDDLIRKLDERHSLLADLKQSMPGLVEKLDSSLSSNIGDAESWGIDVDDDVLESLRENRGLISKLESALGKEKPKYLEVKEDFENSKSVIGRDYQTARSQHEQANQLRADIESTAASIDRLEREIQNYYASNSRYLYGGAPSYSYEASTRGKRTQLSSTLGSLSSVLSRAKSDLNNAEGTVARKKAEERAREEAERRRRDEEARQRAAAAASISSSSHSSGGGMSGNRGGV